MKRDLKGFTLIELMIVIAIIAVIAAIAIPSLLESRMAANETKAIGALKAINSAQAIFRRRKGFYAGGANALSTDLKADGGLDSNMSDNTADYSGFSFTSNFPGSSTVEKWVYGVSATPVVWSESGKFNYYTNASSTLWQTDTQADASPGDGSDAAGGTWRTSE